ncbi:NADH dehydrogenase subunit 2 (mitochondrion) [Limulus polyphemus]|uniref:NADH-ubiquinone oxidoreductase chain 2 n=3 Tax=Limulus polyphemus TaxID=6850 RepID=Q9MLP5_LIMPO|nr:NADH dehydrogenase subunit 2 [Limulus polyphemus]AAF72121.1 NADH dehydrogenase subunit 2 [Limulus polyphemus]
MLTLPIINLFSLPLILGTMITMSSSSWLMAWMGLEMNLMGFIPLISTHSNKRASEASLKYFLIQTIASSTFLFSFLLSSSFSIIQFTMMTPWMIPFMVILTLSVKLGAAPFHMWLPTVAEGLSWTNCLILMSWQKMAPLSIISMIFPKNPLIIIIATLSAISGSMGGLNQTSLRKILAFSSISHMAWMLSSMLISKMLWLFYIFIYSIIISSIILCFAPFNMLHINQVSTNQNKKLNSLITINLLSLGGLPPFLGFLPKWLIMFYLLQMNMFLMVSILIISTLINLYYYTRISYSSLLLINSNNKWMKTKTPPLTKQLPLSMISLFGLITSMLTFTLL